MHVVGVLPEQGTEIGGGLVEMVSSIVCLAHKKPFRGYPEGLSLQAIREDPLMAQPPMGDAKQVSHGAGHGAAESAVR